MSVDEQDILKLSEGQTAEITLQSLMMEQENPHTYWKTQQSNMYAGFVN